MIGRCPQIGSAKLRAAGPVNGVTLQAQRSTIEAISTRPLAVIAYGRFIELQPAALLLHWLAIVLHGCFVSMWAIYVD